MGIKNSILPIVFSVILLTGLVPQSFGQNAGVNSIPADQVPPTYRGMDCSLTYGFSGFPLVPHVPNPLFPFDCSGGPLSNFPVEVIYDPPLVIPPGVGSQVVEGQTIHIHLPNFVDPFNTKLVRVQMFFDPPTPPPFVFNIKPLPNTLPSCTKVDSGSAGPGHLFEDWICHPNPDNERIWIELPSGFPNQIIDVIIDTVSFNEVGGTFEDVNPTALLIAGAQANALWMIPLILSAIGIAIVIARKF